MLVPLDPSLTPLQMMNHNPKSVEPTLVNRPPLSSLAILGLCAAFMLTGVMVLAWLGSTPPKEIQGKLLPAIALDPLTNTEGLFNSNQLIGKKTLIYLWSPESQACRDNVSQLKQLIENNSDWSIVTVAFVEKGGLVVESLRAEVEKFMTENSVNWPTYVDTTGKATMELTLLMPFGSFGFPTIFAVDEHGKLVHICEGTKVEEWKTLEQAIATRRP